MAEKRYIKTWNSTEAARKTVGGPDYTVGGMLVDLWAEINAGLVSGNLDITPSLGDTLVTTTDTQTISGAKTLSGTTTISGELIASNATVTLSGIPEYADNAAALVGGLTAGDLYKTAAGALNITVAA